MKSNVLEFSYMKIDLSFLLFIGVFLLVLSTQGVLMFNVFNTIGLWQLKSAVQPIAVFIILIYFLLSHSRGFMRISQIDFILFGYFAFSCIFLFLNFTGLQNTYIAAREVFLVYFLIFIFNQESMSLKYWNIILYLIFTLVIVNIFFTFLIYFIGWERYTQILIGEIFWNTHKDYAFKISSFIGAKVYRVPALVGEATMLGHFGLISFFLLKDHKKFKYLAYLPLIIVAACFIRSVYVILIVYLFLLGISTSKKFTRFILYSLPLVPIVLFILIRYNLLDVRSLIMRFAFWGEKLNVNYNIFYGGAIGNVGAASTTGGFEDTIDNYWIFLFFSIGIVGILLILIFLFEKTRNKNDLMLIIVAFFISGMFVTLSQSVVFVSMLPLLFLNYNILNRSSK